MHKRPNARGYRPHHEFRLDKNGKVQRLYRIWLEMRSRCMNPKRNNYKWYGGKGVSVCASWDDYINFHKDMSSSYIEHIKIYGEKNTTLDRIDSKKGYCQKNCRWATRKKQNNNTISNVFVTYLGETKTIAEWSEKLGIKYTTLHARIVRYNIPIEKALTVKPSKHNHKYQFR